MSGTHLAVHYRQSSGDMDASAAVSGLRHAEYSHGSTNHTFRLDIADSRVWVDASVIIGDIELSAAGRIDGFPNTVRIGLADGAPSYSADAPIGILAQVRAGKVAALNGLGAPLFDNGIAVRARGCGGGGGCSSDDTPFCSTLDRCFGVAGTISLPALLTSVSLDLEERTASVQGYTGPSTFELYVGLEAMAPASGAAMVTLTGLPSGIDVTIDDTSVGKGSVALGYTASTGIGSIEVLAEGTDTPAGEVRGRAFLSNVPSQVHVRGTYGSATDITYDATAAIDRLELQATGTVEGGLASGLVRFTGIPASMHFEAGGFGEGNQGFNVPTLQYSASDSTLDGLVQVEAALAREVGPVVAGIDDLYFQIRNLGASTTIEVTDAAANVTSSPATESIGFGAGVHVSALPVTNIDEHLGECCFGFFEVLFAGHFGMGESRIDDIDVLLSNISSLSLFPANTHGLLPAAAGFLFPGITGDYGALNITLGGVDLRPDVDLVFRIDRAVGPDVVNESLHLSPTDNVRFHWYDQTEREAARFHTEVGPIPIACIIVSGKPGRVGSSPNSLELHGADGPQMFTFLDPGGDVEEWILDLLAVLVSPFPDSGITAVGVEGGSC